LKRKSRFNVGVKKSVQYQFEPRNNWADELFVSSMPTRLADAMQLARDTYPEMFQTVTLEDNDVYADVPFVDLVQIDVQINVQINVRIDIQIDVQIDIHLIHQFQWSCRGNVQTALF
jgi:hypothetical protein